MSFTELWKRVCPSQDEEDKKTRTAVQRRLELLFDPGSFVEIDSLVIGRCREFGMENKNVLGDGVVGGFGTVEGNTVYAYAQDAKVLGGALGEMHAAKIEKLLRHALEAEAPIVAFIESGGARIQEGVDALSGYGRIFYLNTLASGKIPQISAIMGTCAGGAVYSPALTDFIFMMREQGKMFVTGPAVIRSVTGEQVTPQELGGAGLHGSSSGVAHFIENTEEDCIRQIRTLLGYYFDASRQSEMLSVKMEYDSSFDSIIPDSARRPYDMRDVIRRLVDQGEYLEYMKDFAPNILTCFARVGNMTVGIVANQPMELAGCIDINASDKAARFVRTCDSYHFPIVSLVDVPGFLPGVEQEHGGIIRHGAKMLYAYGETTVPKVTLILRKAYGGAYLAMGCKELGADFVYAWPGAEIAVMGAEGAADIIFGKLEQIEKESRMKAYIEEFSNPYAAARRGIVDQVIEPGNSRWMLIRTLAALQGKKKEFSVKKKHGNIPL